MCSPKLFISFKSTDKINGRRGWLALNPYLNIVKPYILQNVRIVFCNVISSNFIALPEKKKDRNLLQTTKGRYGWGHHPYTLGYLQILISERAQYLRIYVEKKCNHEHFYQHFYEHFESDHEVIDTHTLFHGWSNEFL